MPQQLGNRRVTESFVSRDAAEGAPQIVRSRVLQPGGVEQRRERFLHVRAAFPVGAREYPFDTFLARLGPDQIERWLADRAYRASRLRPFEAQGLLCFVNLATALAARLRAAR